MQMVIKEPVGPVAAFTPWNFPINQVVRKLSAALATGCSIIVKAPEETPACCRAGRAPSSTPACPAASSSLVYGDPAEISEYLIPHPVIRKITFTGSTPVGKQLAALAGQHMKRVDDGARRPRAGDRVRGRRRRQGGEAAGRREVPQRRPGLHLADALPGAGEASTTSFVDGFVADAEGLKVGDGLDAGTSMGPLANAAPHRRRWRASSPTPRRRARELRTGGKRIGNKGNFFEPTVLTDVPLDARIMNEEPFGPVAAINRFDDDRRGDRRRRTACPSALPPTPSPARPRPQTQARGRASRPA